MRRISECGRCLRDAVSEQRLNRHLGMPPSSTSVPKTGIVELERIFALDPTPRGTVAHQVYLSQT